MCKSLSRLDVSKNELASLDGLGAVTSLRWLSAAGNAVTSAEALRDLEKLEVRLDACVWELCVGAGGWGAGLKRQH